MEYGINTFYGSVKIAFLLNLFLQIATQLQQRVHVVGNVCMEMVRDGAEVQAVPDDQMLKQSLAEQARVVTEKVCAC